jgi:hypothetical protein
MSGKSKYNKPRSNIIITSKNIQKENISRSGETFSKSLNNYNSIREQIENGMKERITDKPKDSKGEKPKFKIA